MTTYYVRKTGNDTTGDGSTEKPWLTVYKAITTGIPAAGGHTLLIGDGTYVEDDGSGYWIIYRAFTAMVTIAPESGVLGSVTIRGNGHATYNIWFGSASSNMTFNKIDWSTATTPTRATILIRGNTSSHLKFTNCNIPFKVEVLPNPGQVYSDIVFDACTLNWIICEMEGGTGLVIKNCFVSGGNVADGCISMSNATGILVENNIVNQTTGVYGIRAGEDADSSLNTITGLIQGNSVTGIDHCVLIGAGCNGIEVKNNIITGSVVYGLIIKENTGTVVTGNTIIGGSSSTIYCKAAVNPVIQYNRLSASQGHLLLVGKGTTNKSSGVNFQYNTLMGSAASYLLLWPDSTEDAGGGICDYNKYRPKGTGKFGAVRGDASVLTIEELRAAWADYGDASNDSHSWVNMGDGFMMLYMLVRR